MMAERFDLVVVGAGPAGMQATITARAHGLSVLVLDEQAGPGGQIWRSIENNAGSPLAVLLGKEYACGAKIAADFRASGPTTFFGARVFQIESGWRIHFTVADQIRTAEASSLLLAAGAQERPVPFPGWTLPGVMTVGAGQILLKAAGQFPRGPVVVAGNGPLPLLFMHQVRVAGGEIAAYLDTTPAGMLNRAAKHLPRVLDSLPAMLKGLRWTSELRSVPVVRNVTGLSALGDRCLERVSVEQANGGKTEITASTLLIHEGLVPNHQIATSLGTDLRWDESQKLFQTKRDKWFSADTDGLFVAGDCAAIKGAAAAGLEGRLAGLGIAVKAGRVSEREAERASAPLRRALRRQERFRGFLDAAYPPRLAVQPADPDTVICRCEELRACDLEAACGNSFIGPNQLKAFTRVGMGPCQGRQCGYSVNTFLAARYKCSPQKIGLFNPRPPFTPLSVGMVARWQSGATNADEARSEVLEQ